MDNYGEILIYQTVHGLTKIDVNMQDETVWLSLDQMAYLFQRDKSAISRHIKNIFEEGELARESTVAKFATVQNEGNRQVEREIPMTMEDWAKHLDGILTSTGENLLLGNGSVSHLQAMDKAQTEYNKYKAKTLSSVEKVYLESIKLLEEKGKQKK